MTEDIQTLSAQTAHHPQCSYAAQGWPYGHECFQMVHFDNWPVDGKCHWRCLMASDYKGKESPGHRCFTGKFDLV